MGRKGLACLEALVSGGCLPSIAGAVVARDAAVQEDYADDIIRYCAQHHIPCFERQQVPAVIPAHGLAIAVSWRWLIPATAAPLVVLHDSLLPKYRGFAPLVSALKNSEPVIGVTALFATSDFDRGDVIAREAIPVDYPITIAHAIELVSGCYQRLVLRMVQTLSAGMVLEGIPQQEAEASYSVWLDADDYLINWNQPAALIRRHIDSVGYPFQGAATRLDGRLIRVWAAEEEPDVVVENRAPGKTLFRMGDCPVVICGTGLLRLTQVTDDAGNSLLPFSKFRCRFT